MRWIALLVELVGLGLIAWGVAMIYVPAAFVVVGILVIVGGLLVEPDQ